MLKFINPGKTLAPWVLVPEQESCLPYIRKGNKEDLPNYIPISLIFRCNNVSISKDLLHHPTYGNKFIHIVEVVYTNIQSKIKINDLFN